MIEKFLISDLAKFLREVLREERMETPVDNTPEAAPNGSLFEDEADQKQIVSELRPITVYEGFLPPRSTLEQDHPFVCVRPVSGTVDHGCTRLEVCITIGVYAEDLKGYFDALHIYRAIASALSSLKNNWLAKKYEHEPQMSWQWSSSRDDPYWGVDLNTTWLLYTDKPEIEKWL